MQTPIQKMATVPLGEQQVDHQIMQEAQALERKTIELIQQKNWQTLEDMLDPACQFVTSQGACNRDQATALMKQMHLGPVEFKDFQVTMAGDTLVISFWLAAVELRDGIPLSAQFLPRLSVWKKVGSQWKCIAYADLIGSQHN